MDKQKIPFARMVILEMVNTCGFCACKKKAINQVMLKLKEK